MQFTINKNTFGQRVDYPKPSWCDAVIIGTLGRSGRVPHHILLPHQVYAADVLKTLRDTGSDTYEIIPIACDQIVSITEAELRAAIERATVNEALARLPWGVRVGEVA